MNAKEQVKEAGCRPIRPEIYEIYPAVIERYGNDCAGDMFFASLLYDIGYSNGIRAERERRKHKTE